MKRGLRIGLIALIFLVAFAVSFLMYVRSHGFSARETPSRMEEIVARNLRRIAIPAGSREMMNPVKQTGAGMIEARVHFVEHCSICHGIDGRGETTIGQNLYPKSPDMTGRQTQQLSDGELFYIITNGIRFTGMPAWGDVDSKESIWDLVSFIRRLPELTLEELKQMQDIESPEESEMSDSKEKGKPARSGGHTHGTGSKPHKH